MTLSAERRRNTSTHSRRCEDRQLKANAAQQVQFVTQHLCDAECRETVLEGSAPWQGCKRVAVGGVKSECKPSCSSEVFFCEVQELSG